METPLEDPISLAIVSRAEAILDAVIESCQQARDHLRNRDHIAAIGALAGAGDRVQYCTAVLSVLRDIEPSLNQPSIPFNPEKGGENP